MVGWVKVGHVFLSGHLDEADHIAQDALKIGQSSDQPDARLIFVLQRSVIRFEQGRLGELERELSDMCARLPAIPGLAILLAAAHHQLGHNDEARSYFQRLAATSFELPTDPLWLGFLTLAADLACHFDDHDSASVLYDTLRPYPTVFAVVAGVSTGCAAHYLGVLATTLCEYAAAEDHFIHAARAHERIGAPALLGRTWVEWARLLLRRQEPGDAGRSVALLERALASARERGLVGVGRQAAALLNSSE